MQAGFDGVHMHGGHGYLISEFSSPYTNRRTDRWGGDAERRGRFAEAVVEAVRRAVGADVPVAMKLGVCDAIPGGGLTLDEGLALAERLERAGLDAIEVSVGLTVPGTGSSRTYVAVDRRRAWQDGLLHRLASAPTPESYFAEWARAVKARVRIPVILIGGLRRIETMERMLREGVADFVSLARPFVREPDLVRTIAAGRAGLVACTSCNICLMHEGRDALRCWRRSWGDLLEHALKHYVLDGLGLRRA